jgi:hypothetical protein
MFALAVAFGSLTNFAITLCVAKFFGWLRTYILGIVLGLVVGFYQVQQPWEGERVLPTGEFVFGCCLGFAIWVFIAQMIAAGFTRVRNIVA